MAARVQIEIEANDRASAVLRGITSQFGMFGRVISDAGSLMAANSRLAQAQATALRAVETGAENAAAAISALALAEKEQEAAAVRMIESTMRLGIEGAKKLYEFAEAGAQLELVETRFGRLAESIGATSDALLGDLKQATGGMYSDAQLMKSALDLMSLGLVKSQEEAVRLSTVMGGLNMPMNQLVLAMTNMTTMRFDSLGVSVDGFDERLKHLTETMKGASEQDIFKEAFLQQAEEQLLRVGSAADTSAGQFMQAEAEWANFMDGLKKGSLGAVLPVITKFNELNKASASAQDALQELVDDGVIPAGTNLRFLSNEQEEMVRQVKVSREMTEFYTNSVEKQNEALAANAEAVKLIDYKTLIGDIQGYQAATDKFVDTHDEIIESSTELIQSQNHLEASYNSLTDWQKKYSSEGKKIPGQLEEIKNKLAENSDALAKNEEAYRRWAAQAVFAFAQARAAADGNISEIEGEVLIQAGEALGLFDEQTVEAMKGVNEAFDDLDASNAQEVIDTLQAQLNALVDNPYNIMINANLNGNLGSGSSDQSTHPGGGGQQTGGTVYAGQSYMVGEAGPEPFFPKVDGRILSHAEAIHAASLGGGGSQTNYIYGPVTLAIASDGAGGLMEMR